MAWTISDLQRNCPHPDFFAKVGIQRFEDTGKFLAEVTVNCSVCDLPFRFVGVEAGLHFDQPRVSIDGLELRAPIEPETEKQLRDSASFHMPAIPTRQ